MMSSVLDVLTLKCHRTCTGGIQEVGGNTALKFRRKDPEDNSIYWRHKNGLPTQYVWDFKE